MIKKNIYLILIVLAGCIDPVNFKFAGQVEHLVIESEFTNHPNLQYIRISHSSSFSYPYNQFEKFANVYVSGNDGEYYQFKYKKAGYYYPDTLITGVAGHTYTLHINLADGKSYESLPIKMKDPVPIDTVYYRYGEEYAAIEGQDEKILSPGYYIYVNFKDPSENGNFFRWSLQTQYEVWTHPENYIDYDCCFNPVRRPKKCCSHCWINETIENFLVKDDRIINGQEVIGQKVLFIPYYKYLNFKNKLTVLQHSITEEEYLFYKTLYNQSQSTGGILDPPPSETKGNIFNIAGGEDNVIGFFDVSALSSFLIILNGNDIQGDKHPFVWDDDCLQLANSTTQKPADW